MRARPRGLERDMLGHHRGARILRRQIFLRSPGMDFRLSDEQKQIKQMVREFAESEIKPHVMEWDEAQHFPMETVKKLGGLGVLGAIFPEQYGGAGLSYVD